MIAFSTENQTELRQLKRAAAGLQAAIDDLQTQLAVLRKRQQNLYDSLNFRERHLGGRFGGDKQKVEYYGRVRKDVARVREQYRDYRYRLQTTNRELNFLLHQLLMEHDEQYVTLRRRADKGEQADEAVDALLLVVREVAEDVTDAQNSCLATGVVIGIPVPMGSRDLGDDEQALERALNTYRQTIDEFSPRTRDYLTEPQAALRISIDLAEIFGDGPNHEFDYAELSDIQDRLELLRQQAVGIQSKVREMLKRLEKQLRDIRDQTLASID